MDVLVIGGTGFLSGAVVGELREAGHEVTIFTRGQRPVPEGVQVIQGDRKDYARFPTLFEGRPFDAVVDCICYTPEDARSDLQAFAGRVGHFLMISTDFVYGPHRRLPMTEDTGTQAMSTYGRNKVLCEQILFEAHGEERFPATVFRPPHIMGSGSQLGTGSLQNRDPMLLSRMQQRSPVVLLDGGQLLIQPAHHRDIGRACAAALGKPATFGRAYHCSGPECVTSKEYYDLVAAALGIEDPAYLSFPSAEFVRLFPERAPFAFHRMYSMDRLATDTGYRPRTTIAHAIFEMIDWLQATGNAKEFVETEQDTAMAALCQAFTEEARKVLSS